ncbi:MAG: hypothetical protein V7785_17545 [Bermanella sp.]
MDSRNKLFTALLASAILSGCGSSDESTNNNAGEIDNPLVVTTPTDEEQIRTLATTNQVSSESIDGTWLVVAQSENNGENHQSTTNTRTLLTIDSNHGLTLAMCSNGNGASGQDSSYSNTASTERKLIAAPAGETETIVNDSSTFNMPYSIIEAILEVTLGEGGDFQASIEADNNTIQFTAPTIYLSGDSILSTTMTLYKIRNEASGPIGRMDWELGNLNGQPDLYCLHDTVTEYSGSGDVSVKDSQYEIDKSITVSNDLSDDKLEQLTIREVTEFNDDGEINLTKKFAKFDRGDGNYSQTRESNDGFSYGQYNLTHSNNDILHYAVNGSMEGQGGEVVKFNSLSIDLSLATEDEPDSLIINQ